MQKQIGWGSPTDQMRGKTVVPSARCLLQSIQRFVETTNKIRMRRIIEPQRLGRVHGLSQSAIEEGVLDIKLVDGI